MTQNDIRSCLASVENVDLRELCLQPSKVPMQALSQAPEEHFKSPAPGAHLDGTGISGVSHVYDSLEDCQGAGRTAWQALLPPDLKMTPP